MSWIGRIWRRAVGVFRRRQGPPPPPPPPPIYYYAGARPRSAYDGEQGGGRAPKPEAKRMRFQPPTPEALAQIKEALDEQAYTFNDDLVKGISVSNPDFGTSDSNQLLE